MEVLVLLKQGPWRKSGTEEGSARRFPAMGMAGGEGKQGGKREGVRADLRVVSDGSGATGRWVTGDEQGRRPWELGSGGLE